MNYFRVAAAFEIEDAVLRPAMFVVADQRTVRIRRERRLTGARETEEDRGIAKLAADSFGTELYRIPLVVGPEVYATASLVSIGAATISGLVVRRRIDRLDMIAVLKTRE